MSLIRSIIVMGHGMCCLFDGTLVAARGVVETNQVSGEEDRIAQNSCLCSIIQINNHIRTGTLLTTFFFRHVIDRHGNWNLTRYFPNNLYL